jgi:murein DD-endopeptidase MepM/ murein hydrolase activator NlpD
MRKAKLYKFSSESLSFQEARWTRFRLIFTGLLLGGVIFYSVVVINQYYHNVLGIGLIQQDALVNENRVLQNQLQYLTKRLDGIQRQLKLLGDKGNELRVYTDLPRFDEDLRKAGTGGVEERIDFTGSPDVNTMLNDVRHATEQAAHELQLQLRSYEEIGTRYEQNKKKFNHLPAVKPMEGFFSKHDFGMRFHPILGIQRKHEGIDIINEVGSPIYAPAEGVIDFSGRQSGYGLALEINHGFSLKTLYGHLSKILVHEGQYVKRGDLIARSGNSGLSNGPHLHYEIRLNGIPQNPTDYFFDDVHTSDFQNN